MRKPGSSSFLWRSSPSAEGGVAGPWDGPSGDCGVARPPLRSAASPSSSLLSPYPLVFDAHELGLPGTAAAGSGR